MSGSPVIEEEGLSAEDRTRELVERRRLALAHRRGWLVRRMLLLADVLGLLAAFFLAEVLIDGGVQAENALYFLVTLPVWVLVARLYGLYSRDETTRPRTSSRASSTWSPSAPGPSLPPAG
jgi:hypothetical protein